MARAVRRPVWKRRWVRVLCVCLVLWGALCHFVVRRQALLWLDENMVGTARVPVAVIWPWMEAQAFGVSVRAPNHELSATRATVSVNPFGLFGDRPVRRVHLYKLEAVLKEGEGFDLFKEESKEQQVSARAEANLDPPWMPAIFFTDPVVRVREQSGAESERLSAQSAELHRHGDREYRLTMRNGTLRTVPFEKLSADLVPRAGHLLVDRLKLHAFDGLLEGFLDIGPGAESAINGKLTARSIELEALGRCYGFAYAEELDGRVEGEVVFRGRTLSARHLEGKGRFKLEDGNFVSPVSMEVVLLLKLPVSRPSVFRSGEVVVSFGGGRLYVERATAHGSSFDLEGQGIITFDGHVDLEVTHSLTAVSVTGTLAEPKATILPVHHVTRPFERMFREDLPK